MDATLNSRMICWDLEMMDRSAAVTIEVCSVLTTSTFSKPYPSSPAVLFEKSSRILSKVLEHRTKALWSSFCPAVFTGLPVPPTSASCISNCLPSCRHLPTLLPSLTVSHSLSALLLSRRMGEALEMLLTKTLGLKFQASRAAKLSIG